MLFVLTFYQNVVLTEIFQEHIQKINYMSSER